MRVQKLEHACLIIGDKQKLIIDPGEFTTLPSEIKDISTIVVTEEHFDHFSPENITQIVAANPEAQIFSTAAVAAQLEEQGIKTTAVTEDQVVETGGFKLSFTIGEHAPVYQKSPCGVITVQVDNFLYYAADSYIPPSASVKVLALPTSGPWFKIEEVIDYAKSIDSKLVLATHNYLNSDSGNDVTNRFLEANLGQDNREWVYLQPGDSKQFE